MNDERTNVAGSSLAAHLLHLVMDCETIAQVNAQDDTLALEFAANMPFSVFLSFLWFAAPLEHSSGTSVAQAKVISVSSVPVSVSVWAPLRSWKWLHCKWAALRRPTDCLWPLGASCASEEERRPIN